jgi:hypothetical protein
MMLGLHGSGLASTTCVFDVGVERGVWLVGVGLAHCWVLKHQAPRSSASAWVVGCGGSGSSLCFAAPVGCGGGLVGLLFEICIVDASIN